MRIVHINYDATWSGGASIAMLRMHRKMRAEGIDSQIVCICNADEPGAVLHRRGWARGLLLFTSRVIMKVLFGHCRSTGLFPSGLPERVNALNPDKVIIHWIQNDVMSVAELKEIKAPMEWYFHDLWPIRGLTPCDYYKVPRRMRGLDRLVRRQRRRVIQSLKGRLTPLCASQWVAKAIRESACFEGFEPRLVSLTVEPCFTPRARGANTSHDKFTILAGACKGVLNGIKGLDRLFAAIELLTDQERTQIKVVVFGEEGARRKIAGVPVECVGWKMDEELADLYRSADVFAFPSHEETYGQTKLEALACGIPVIAFDETACAEGIVHKQTGWISPPNDLADYAEGIRHYLRQCTTFDSLA